MSKERIAEIKEHLFLLESKIRPLEWDAGRKQINPSKKVQLDKLKEELNALKNELQQLEQK